MKIKHILVQYEYQAQDVLTLLNQGKSFESLAERFSICSSAKSGGDLGELKKGKTIQEFEEACELLKPGQISKKPTRTSFGYHIIYKYE